MLHVLLRLLGALAIACGVFGALVAAALCCLLPCLHLFRTMLDDGGGWPTDVKDIKVVSVHALSLDWQSYLSALVQMCQTFTCTEDSFGFYPGLFPASCAQAYVYMCHSVA
jgi:hypothetical protein